MSWKNSVQWEMHRRAVVSGRAFERTGETFTDAASLVLRRAVDANEPGALKVTKKNTNAQLDAETERAQSFACHIRRGGVFFFLDVPAGRYAVNRLDAAGKIVQTKGVSVPPFDRKDGKAKMPIASIDFEIVRQANETDQASGRRAVGPGTS